ncbi:UNVERIFIED_CONTAM: hypothetical protein K2H54_061828 [Gekko kuhli]
MAAAQEEMAQELLKPGDCIKMEEQESAGSEPEEEMEAADGLTVGRTGEVLLREPPQLVKQEPEEELSRNWDAQLQEFLKTLQAPCSRGDSPQLPEPRQWNDCRPVPSEGVMEATKWSGGLWASQPQPVPIGEVKQDHEAACCGKEKERVPSGDTVGVEIQGSSEDTFVNLPKTSKELPGTVKKQCFMEAKQCAERSADVSAGDGWLSETEEELKPFFESPEEEEPEKMMSEMAKENRSPHGRKGVLS